MQDAFLILLTVAGGLGTFLLGMKHLSEGLQAISVLVELDIINAYERVRAYYLNIAETLAGGKNLA